LQKTKIKKNCSGNNLQKTKTTCSGKKLQGKKKTTCSGNNLQKPKKKTCSGNLQKTENLALEFFCRKKKTILLWKFAESKKLGLKVCRKQETWSRNLLS
jgi:hypothetical protein